MPLMVALPIVDGNGSLRTGKPAALCLERSFPSEPNGVFAFEPTAFRSLASVLFTPLGWRKVVRWSFERICYAFVNSLPPDQQRAAYEQHGFDDLQR